MQLICLTFVLRNKSGRKVSVYGNMIHVITKKTLPILELKTLQDHIKGTSLDSLKYIEFWRDEFKYLIPECCGDNFCLLVSEKDSNSTLLATQVGWEVKDTDILDGIVDSWSYLVPLNLLSREYMNVLSVRHHGQQTTSAI